MKKDVKQFVWVSLLVILAGIYYFKFDGPQLQKETLVWEKIPVQAFSPRDSHASYIFDEKIWVSGGLDGNPVVQNKYVEYWKAEHFNDIWSTEDGVNWKKEAEHAAWPPRRSHSVVNFGGELYLLGGWGPIEGYKSDIWKSGDGIYWNRVTEGPWEPREGQTLNVFDNKLWLMGGVNFDSRKVFNDIWSSSDGIYWEKITENAKWTPRYDHAVNVFEENIWLTGGLKLQDSAFPEIWKSPNGIDWELVSDDAPWGPIHGHDILNFKDGLWVISGWNTTQGKGSNTVWRSQDGTNWEKISETPWLGREDHGAVSFQDKIWILGGMDENWKWSDEIWSGKILK